jgi:hypothetical protein
MSAVVGIRPARSLLVVGATVITALGVILWGAWPAPTHRLSRTSAARACARVAASHGGEVRDSYGLSVAAVKTIDATLHGGAGAFIASLPKSNGVAECTIVVPGSDLRPGCGFLDATFGLATPDGAHFVVWCPIP